MNYILETEPAVWIAKENGLPATTGDKDKAVRYPTYSGAMWGLNHAMAHLDEAFRDAQIVYLSTKRREAPND